MTLDRFLDDRRLAGGSVDLIKIDVEGYESEVLAGAQGVIERHRPIIICEIERRHSLDPLKVFRTLAQSGYACFALRAGVLTPFDPEGIAEVQDNRGISGDLVGRIRRRRQFIRELHQQLHLRAPRFPGQTGPHALNPSARYGDETLAGVADCRFSPGV